MNDELAANHALRRFDPRSFKEMGIEAEPYQQLSRSDLESERHAVATSAGSANEQRQWSYIMRQLTRERDAECQSAENDANELAAHIRPASKEEKRKLRDLEATRKAAAEARYQSMLLSEEVDRQRSRASQVSRREARIAAEKGAAPSLLQEQADAYLAELRADLEPIEREGRSLAALADRYDGEADRIRIQIRSRELASNEILREQRAPKLSTATPKMADARKDVMRADERTRSNGSWESGEARVERELASGSAATTAREDASRPSAGSGSRSTNYVNELYASIVSGRRLVHEENGQLKVELAGREGGEAIERILASPSAQKRLVGIRAHQQR